MTEVDKDIQISSYLKGLTACILKEVIKADISMHAEQSEAWIQFSQNKPKGLLINNDILLGFAEKRYLCLNEIKFSFNVKKVKLNFRNRFKLIIQLLQGTPPFNYPSIFEFCSPKQKDAIYIEMIVKRFENGTVKASYKAADSLTSELLEYP